MQCVQLELSHFNCALGFFNISKARLARAVFPNLLGLRHPTEKRIAAPSGGPIAICFKIQWHFENVFLMTYWKMSFLAALLRIVNGT